jgi:putative ABC transport system permease protein
MSKGTAWMNDLARDLRFGCRHLVRQPAFTLVAIGTLALGIGGATVMFSVVDAVLLKGLPYPYADRLALISEIDTGAERHLSMLRGEHLLAWRERATSFDALSVLLTGDATMVSGEEAFEARVACLSDSVQTIFGVTAVLGRDFIPSDFVAAPAGPGLRASAVNGTDNGVAILSDRLHRRRFGADRTAIGQRIAFGSISYVIVGVLPASFRLPVTPSLQLGIGSRSDVDVFLNTTVAPTYRGPGTIIGPLKHEVQPRMAASELSVIRDDVDRLRSEASTSTVNIGVETLHEHVVRDHRGSLLVLSGAVAVVMFISIFNVLNLLIARWSSRGQEVAVRRALGASRGRLLRQSLAESVLLTLIGGFLALALARGAVQLLIHTTSVHVPRLQDSGINWVVLCFSALVCTASVAVFSLPPMFVRGMNMTRSLRDGSTKCAHRYRHWRSALVIFQLALALIPLTGAGLMLRSLWSVDAEAAVLHPSEVLTAQIQGRASLAGNSMDANPDEVERVVDDIRSLPGVRSVALWRINFGFRAQVSGLPSQDPEIIAMWFNVSPEFLGAAGIRLLAGRWFTDKDPSRPSASVVVSEGFRKRFASNFPTPASLVGRTTSGPPIGSNADETPRTIIGVATDFRSGRFGILQPDDLNAPPQVFFSDLRRVAGTELLVRAEVDPIGLVAPVRRIIDGAPNLRIVSPQSLSDQVRGAVAPRTFNTFLFVLLSGLAFLLSIVGVVGVMWNVVSERTQEIGVRVALGAERRAILRMILSHAAALAAIGVAGGVAASVLLSRYLESLLYNVSALDAGTYLTASTILFAAALIAAYVPGRRAAQVNPVIALRAS